jgi:two-component system, LytTR family, response regulator AlgR
MRLLIADDESLARERLRALIGGLDGIEVVGDQQPGREVLTQCATLQPDCVLLDIAMPAMDGLEAARHLTGFDPPPAVIFCTAYDEHALAAFEASAVDYVVKPVRRERLSAALERARRFTGEQYRAVGERLGAVPQRTHICARLRGNLKLVPVAEVAYFLAEDKYVAVRHAGGEVLVEESLKALEDEFGDRFVRIHRNCLVATDRLSGLRRTPDGRMYADVRDAPEPLEVSRRNLPALRRLVKSL